ncbi:MAG: hypothetical protein GXP27_20125 [Planctomycetes bacterium]|nr:hypothetical protein [Planctomycetota bacterium]
MAAIIQTAARIACTLAVFGLFHQDASGQTERPEATASRPKLMRLAHHVVHAARTVSHRGLTQLAFRCHPAVCPAWCPDNYRPKCPPTICPPEYCGYYGCYRPKCPPHICLPRYCGTGECYQPKCPPPFRIPCGTPWDGK